MSDTFLGVQPIFDRQQNVVAYELLFRCAGGGFEGQDIDADTATSQVIINAFTDIGVERLGQDKLLFLNLSESLLASDVIQALPPNRVVLEVLETVHVTPKLVAAARELVKQGFTLALDDFVYTPDWDPLLLLAEIVKFDVLGDNRAQIRAKLHSLPSGCQPRLLAEKVETREQFQDCLDLGFELFQGYYLARPQVLTGKRPPDSRVHTLRLMTRLQDENSSVADIEQIISQDVTLSYRLLRFLSSASVSQGRTIDTIKQGIVLVGLRLVRQWAALLMLSNLNASEHAHCLTRSLTYARFCQLIGERYFPADKDTLFTVGLFANLDELLQVPLMDALEHLPLDERIKQAILAHEGLLGQVLAQAKRFEYGARLSDVIVPDVKIEALAVCFLEAFAWANDLQAQIQHSH